MARKRSKPVYDDAIAAEKVKEWVKTPQGQASIRKALDEVAEQVATLNARRVIDPRELDRPFTI